MRGLLPCPFCGWAAIMREWTSGMHYYRAECSNTEGCDCHGLQHLTLEEAIAAWNRRADAVPVVRCEECSNKEEHSYYCLLHSIFVRSDFFCKDGGCDK
jgi:Lar family restriction alleviation protein